MTIIYCIPMILSFVPHFCNVQCLAPHATTLLQRAALHYVLQLLQASLLVLLCQCRKVAAGKEHPRNMLLSFLVVTWGYYGFFFPLRIDGAVLF